MSHVRVFIKKDGSVLIAHPAFENLYADEPEEVWLERTWDRLLEATTNLHQLLYFDTTTDKLPSRIAPCTECGQVHSVRDLWSVAANNSIVIDRSAPDAEAFLAHLYVRRNAELDKSVQDASAIVLAQIDRAIARVVAIIQSGTRQEIQKVLDDNKHVLGN